MKCMIVAYSKNHVIGNKGQIPWQGKMKDDSQHFVDLSRGKTNIMGRKTYESIGHALPDRQNIVVSREAFEAPDALVVHSLEDAYKNAETDDIAIIGGGQIYAAALKDTDIVYATEIDVEVEGDATFPKLGDEWEEAERRDLKADERNIYDYSFITYRRKK